MPYEDNLFLRMSPAGIIARVAASDPTLAVVSALSVDEQIRIGWLGNPAVERLYELTSAGVWTPRTDTSGRVGVSDTSVQAYSLVSAYQSQRTIAAPSNSSTVALSSTPRRAQIAMNTDGSGVKAATTLHTGPTGYYPVVRLKRIVSDVADAATTINITVGGGGALLGPATFSITLVANVVLELNDLLLYNLTDASSILMAIADGPVSGTIWLEYEYWSET